MKISVLGLGYVGCRIRGLPCQRRPRSHRRRPRAHQGRPDQRRASSPIIEKDIGEIIARAGGGRAAARHHRRRRGGAPHRPRARLRRHAQPAATAASTCKYVRRVCEQIGQTLATHPGAPVIVMRSTMLPGTMRDVVIPTLEKFSGKQRRRAIRRLHQPRVPARRHRGARLLPPAEDRDRRGRTARAATCSPRSTPSMPGPMIRTDIETAEMVKYADNAWHALKVGFANEIGNLCKALGVDATSVMDIFCQDTKLNLSPYYLKPGLRLRRLVPAEGRARAALQGEDARRGAADPRRSILPSNELQIERGMQAVIEQGQAARSASSASASRPAPTTCARARWSSSPSA